MLINRIAEKLQKKQQKKKKEKIVNCADQQIVFVFTKATTLDEKDQQKVDGEESGFLYKKKPTNTLNFFD